MRTRLFALLLASMMVAPAAHADTYQFTFEGNYVPLPPDDPQTDPLNAGPTLLLAWQLTGAPDAVDDFGFPYYSHVPHNSTASTLERPANVAVSGSTDPQYPITYISFLSTEGGSASPDFADLETEGSLIYTGSPFNPSFLTGVYAADFSYQTYSLYDGTLTIADLSTVTPEPSTFALLGTGMLGIVGALSHKAKHRRA